MFSSKSLSEQPFALFSLGIKGNKIARLEKAAASREQSEWKSAHYMLVCSDNAKNTPRVLQRFQTHKNGSVSANSTVHCPPVIEV